MAKLLFLAFFFIICELYTFIVFSAVDNHYKSKNDVHWSSRQSSCHIWQVCLVCRLLRVTFFSKRSEYLHQYRYIHRMKTNSVKNIWNTCHYITIHYITLHGSKLVKMTVGCEICHTNTKTYVQCNWSFHTKKKQEKTVVTHEAIQKYIHIYTSVLWTYAICNTFKWMSQFLGGKCSSIE
jgi:hypothetical protein